MKFGEGRDHTVRVAIAGGGIGGMALALSLHAAGFRDVDGGGPERCIDIVERRAPNGFVNLDAVISREELEEISRSYKRIAGFDPRILNDRPSLTVLRTRRPQLMKAP
jgi:flavin-dependent dehydrogenase